MAESSSNQKKGSKKKSVIAVFLILAVIISCCVGAVGFYVKKYVPEATVELAEEPKPSLTAAPEKDGFADYLGTLVAKTADSDKVKTTLEANLSIDEDTVTMDASDADVSILKYALNSMLGGVSEQYEKHEGKFGDGFADVPEITFTGADITEFSFEQGVVKEDDEGSKHELDFYYFNVTVDGKNEAVGKAFDSKDINTVIDTAASRLSEMLTVSSHEVGDAVYRIEGKTNRLTDELQEFKLITEYPVKLNVKFAGDYAALGEKAISFTYRVEKKYIYTWAGITIDEDMAIVALGEEKQLTVNAVIEEGAANDEFKLTFESTDESIATITKEGLVSGLKVSDKPVTVRMTLEYKGNVYTDECQVYVVVPVKNVRTNPDKLTLKVGETKQLNCELQPEDATLKEVSWFTEDESIAAISEDGTVTAVKSGTVKVYAVTLDGHFRSSCEVEVK